MPINTSGTATGTIINTFTQNIGIKGLGAILIQFMNQLFIGNEFLIFLMFLLYFIDFIVGLILALKTTRFDLQKFFRGASKLLIYGIFLVIGLSLDETLHTGKFFIGVIFAFVIITDSISILRKINLLGYETPMFLEKYLLSYKKELENAKPKE